MFSGVRDKERSSRAKGPEKTFKSKCAVLHIAKAVVI